MTAIDLASLTFDHHSAVILRMMSQMAKLSEQQIIEIRRRFPTCRDKAGMAKEFGIGPEHLWRVATKRTWTDAPPRKKGKPPSGMNEAERFWSKVQIGAPDECWPWQAARYGKMQYGKFSREREPGRWEAWDAHRVSFELTHGPIPPGVTIRHSCDFGACCNPGHLLDGTQADNMRDMYARKRDRGRGTFGENQGSSKLSDADILAIRRRHRPNSNAVGLAAEFGVDRSQINRIARGSAWKHVKGQNGA